VALARLLNPIKPKLRIPHESVDTMAKFGTPVKAAMNPDVTRPTELEAFKITS
jgi:hypothetical protein